MGNKAFRYGGAERGVIPAPSEAEARTLLSKMRVQYDKIWEDGKPEPESPKPQANGAQSGIGVTGASGVSGSFDDRNEAMQGLEKGLAKGFSSVGPPQIPGVVVPGGIIGFKPPTPQLNLAQPPVNIPPPQQHRSLPGILPPQKPKRSDSEPVRQQKMIVGDYMQVQKDIDDLLERHYGTVVHAQLEPDMKGRYIVMVVIEYNKG